jgi:hypothetical protein
VSPTGALESTLSIEAFEPPYLLCLLPNVFKPIRLDNPAQKSRDAPYSLTRPCLTSSVQLLRELPEVGWSSLYRCFAGCQGLQHRGAADR